VIAEQHGARFERTRTGFKWIWRAALALEASEGVRYCFGYELALGFAAGHVVRDKDGLSAAYLFAELAARCRAKGKSVLEHLSELFRRYGVWASVERAVVRSGVDGALELRLAVDRAAHAYPEKVAGVRVTGRVDYRAGEEARAPWLPNEAVVEWALEGGARLLVRPSGTEPKLKLYADVPEELTPGERVGAAEGRAKARAGELLDAAVARLGLT
jgi:phosphomannomutase